MEATNKKRRIKVKIITFHPGLNYGAVLQAFALQNAIERLNFDVKILDYRPFQLMKKYYRFFVRPVNFFARIRQHYNFMQFRKKFLNQTNRRYRNFNQIKNDKIDADYFVCGSDQVWNTSIFYEPDFSYFLTFARNNQKKVAYAASLGASPFPEKDKEKIKSSLTDFYKISVRERFAQDEVQDLIDKKPEIVVDPTFLLDDYSIIIEEPNDPPGKYILIYAIEYSNFLKENVKIAREILKMPVINISSWHFKQADYNKIGISPNEWLGWFRKATYIITNSFHGTAFSLIFRRNFSFISIEEKIGLNNRIVDLLNSIRAAERIVYIDSKEILIKNLNTQINFDQIDIELKKIRAQSYEFLKSAFDC
jgi:hypothetical protein